MRHGGLGDALGVRAALGRGRAARGPIHSAKARRIGGLDERLVARRRIGGETVERREDHDPRVVDPLHAEIGEVAIEPGRLARTA